MTRGVTGFDGAALRAARLSAKCEEHSHVLTASCLARRVGTSKALVLSYEHGRSSPSPQRLAQLASALRVPATTLLREGAKLSDLRVASGLTMKDLAARLGLAVNTYRRIERDGVLPKRRPGVLWDLADVLRADYSRLRKALHEIPAVQKRRRAASRLLGDVTERAVSRGPFVPVEDTSPEAQLLAMLYRARPAAVSQLMNIYLMDLRQLAAQQAQAQVRLDYTTASSRWTPHYEAEVINLRQEITEAQDRGPELLEQYLTNPMPQQCWYVLAQLYAAGPGGVESSLLDTATVASLERIFDYYLIERTLTGVNLSTPGVLFFTDTLPYYRAIYPMQGVIRPDPQHYGWPPVHRLTGARRRLRTAHLLGHDPNPFWSDTSRPPGRR
ncbi:helix-turn-helix transcriptional regulator [Streptomyces ipomoeae]|uniref:DNA-binding helix-turn-helix protein n=2 Tax=Streptomyces ipomoeae TaxID=103232 RepID=L1KSS2_9ACTN|nr:helix-turn-helix transcriptional regulator [Streptomyces ipomoeae]EKX63525.1 DNA-binding helix-turn-helix protein [Streptomyces ipomoeae 91-03]MDX2693150.1 helix-turn-helix transcriptional regulator [Streptomyces ipomoeae]MDX2824411.1 helix-turn-helix transcriptional regulator [Streptomyces ipomoeae]MDX2838636.1 helix-turn-helix transcriptional regulator [Streptomyces ipomoeae]MDX2872317.1 helix-turn-helix transcriptional regulator [Streptomyces ipomoeae]